LTTLERFSNFRVKSPVCWILDHLLLIYVREYIESVFKFIDGSIGGISFLPKRCYITVRFMLSLRKHVSLFTKNFMLGSTKIHLSHLQWELVVWWTNSGGNVKIVCRSQTVNVKAKRGKNWKSATLFTYPLIFS
jgi:hypothetical protein